MSNQDEEKNTLRSRRFPSAQELMKSFQEIGEEFQKKFPNTEIKVVIPKEKEKDEQQK